MSRTTRSFSLAGAGALAVALVAIFSAAAQAASINYGNFGPVAPGVSFLQVTESSGTDPVPIYGPPSAFSVGLDFNPVNFVATSAGGGADLTDGQLNFTVSSAIPLLNLSLFERGDFTLAGVGTPATQVSAGAVILATVTGINGVPVAPINLPPVNASIGANLVANPGLVQPWSLGLNLNLPAGTTRLDVVVNNAILAVSEPNSVAFIAKKDFIIRGTPIPEPAAFAMTGCVLVGLAMAARKRG